MSTSQQIEDPSWTSTIFSHPFSEAVLSILPSRKIKDQLARQRSLRHDRVPETHVRDGEQQPLLSDFQQAGSSGGYGSNAVGTPVEGESLVRVPKKVATTINVEAKVWFANERTWLAYLNISILLGTLAATLYSASKHHDRVTHYLAGSFGLIAFAVLVYGYFIFQKRVTLISKRSGEHFDEVVFPLLISAAIFIAILANFIIRIKEFREHGTSRDPHHPIHTLAPSPSL